MPKNKKPPQNQPQTLDMPRPDRRMFTYSENQLLDQITTEVMFAWKKDLNIMKNAYNQIIKNSQEHENSFQQLTERFPKIEEFLKKNENYLIDFPEMLEKIKELTRGIATAHSNLASINSRLKIVIDHTREMHATLRATENGSNRLEKRSFWKRIFCCNI